LAKTLNTKNSLWDIQMNFLSLKPIVQRFETLINFSAKRLCNGHFAQFCRNFSFFYILILAAEREGDKIAVEIKSFLNPSAVTDFYAALD